MDEVVREAINRLHDENDRQNHRITTLEEQQKQIQSLVISVERLATNMESMIDEQKKQGERLTKLEQEPGNSWKSVKSTMITSIVSVIAGAIACGIIMLVAQNM